MGVNIYIEPEKSLQCLKEINLCFLFAQNYHLAMKYVANVRKELSIRTIFNILGPLTNPAGATMQVLGVYEKELVEPLAEVLKNLGVKSAMSVYGLDGMDEISASAKTAVSELKDGKTTVYEIFTVDERAVVSARKSFLRNFFFSKGTANVLSLFNVKLSLITLGIHAVIIVNSVCKVGILLYFGYKDSLSYRVDKSRRYIENVSLFYRDLTKSGVDLPIVDRRRE